jgi:hypothetical protein
MLQHHGSFNEEVDFPMDGNDEIYPEEVAMDDDNDLSMSDSSHSPAARTSDANECIDSDPSESSEDDNDLGKLNVDDSDVDSNKDVVSDHKDHTTDGSNDEDNYNEVNGFHVGAYNNNITNNNLQDPAGSIPAGPKHLALHQISQRTLLTHIFPAHKICGKCAGPPPT